MSFRAVDSEWTMGKAKLCFFVMLIITLLTLWLPASEVLALKVWVASWLPMAATLDAADASAYSDKLVHASLFAMLGWLAVRGWVLAPQRWRMVAGLLLLGVLTEALQTQIPGRSASLADWLADTLGLAMGMLLWRPAAAPRVAALRPQAP